jgi:vitamin B12/bleomycin/antimicrobial peptide transport system ATP-binding/permease protein
VPIAATALAAPKYLAGEMSLGDLVSLGPAFVQVQIAMSWLVDNFRQLALWYASAGRVVDMISAMDALDSMDHGTEAAGAAPQEMIAAGQDAR